MSIYSHFILFIYKVITAIVAPLGATFLCYKKRNDPPYGMDVFQLLGFYKKNKSRYVWFHGASVGEINALTPLLKEFIRTHKDEKVVLSTLTTTGLALAKKIEGAKAVIAPLDSPIAVWGFFRAFNPKSLFIIDTELWPNILDRAKKKKCPVVIYNARLQDKNVTKYKKHLGLVTSLISNKLSAVLCMSHNDRLRFIKIGVPEDRVCVTGNIKYDLKPRDLMFDGSRIQKTNLGDNVLGAISIHEGEEQTVIDAYLLAKKENPNIKLIFVPRHQTAGKLACEYLDKLGIKYQLRTEVPSVNSLKEDILIGNTIGEIEFYLGLCDLVFMGGSFVSIGGHNPLEPAYFSIPIVTGPDFHNFTEQFDKLIEVGGAFVAENKESLAKYAIRLLSQRDELNKAGINALDVQQQGRGALQKNLKIFENYL
ncbi:MAG: 3-deoxy-D-manno-octulosonic acid transferase [Aeromonadales bacterium]|nr:3-deoxy-D-manno-octulosonic acid transferase [Aeromonadales bacterium]